MLLITFFLTVIFDLTVAIEVGILLALVLFLMRTNEQTHIRTFNKEIDPNEDTDIQLNLEHLTIPEGVEEIGDGAFYGCTYLEDMVLPSSIRAIGDNCFALCSKLTKIVCNATTPPA